MHGAACQVFAGVCMAGVGRSGTVSCHAAVCAGPTSHHTTPHPHTTPHHTTPNTHHTHTHHTHTPGHNTTLHADITPHTPAGLSAQSHVGVWASQADCPASLCRPTPVAYSCQPSSAAETAAAGWVGLGDGWVEESTTKGIVLCCRSEAKFGSMSRLHVGQAYLISC